MNNTQQLFSDLFQLLRPPPKLTASEWANKHVVLSTEDSAEPGKYSTDRAPYQKEMLDAVSNPDVSDVVYMTGSQIGKTQLIKTFWAILSTFTRLRLCLWCRRWTWPKNLVRHVSRRLFGIQKCYLRKWPIQRPEIAEIRY